MLSGNNINRYYSGKNITILDLAYQNITGMIFLDNLTSQKITGMYCLNNLTSLQTLY